MTRALAPVDVVVSGGGLVAVAIALELARRDLSVELVSGGRAGRPAGPGGPVAAQADAGAAPEAFADLALLSRLLFSDWVAGLEEETGLPCEYDERGAMSVAFDEEGEMALDRSLDAQRARGLHFEVLDPEEARGREPALSSGLHAVFAFPRDGVARAGRVGRALLLAARSAGVRVREGVRAEAIGACAGRVAGVQTSAGLVPAEAVVLAGRGGPDGVAGSPRLRLGASARPWLRLDAADDPDRPTRLLRTGESCLVPRRDGTLLALAGAKKDDPAGGPGVRCVADLLSALERLVPAARDWAVLGTGATRERIAPDRLPVLGGAAPEGLFLAAGWGAEELLLAPAAAAVAADLVTGRVPALATAPFSPDRFGA